MPRSIKRNDLLTKLKKKGFKVEQGSGHITVVFAPKGKVTDCRTHCSRGGKGENLFAFHLKAMSKQLKITEDELMGLYDCSLVEEDFIRIQKEMA